MVVPTLLHWTTWVGAVMALAPLFWYGFGGERLDAWTQAAGSAPLALRLTLPAILCVPYAIVTEPLGWFRWDWFLLYLSLPVAVAAMLLLVSTVDPEQRGHWLELIVLLGLGLAVDLRWFEPAWPRQLAAFNKVLLLDAGLYGFLSIRRLSGVGFDLRLRQEDWEIGMREWAFYAPIAIVLGLALGFLHWHHRIQHAWEIPFAWIFTFFLVAVPEEIFFRGWIQNLLERRLGRTAALVITSILFGLAHFNKLTNFFNWRYVVLAAIAGIFYGRAWRAQRRVGASAITHASIDTLWGTLLR
jgi:membrane protease YdiL (CAAX protease family)